MISRFFLVLFLSLIFIQPGYSSCCDCENNSGVTFVKNSYLREAVEYKKSTIKLQQDRATIYNALNLTDKQIELRENLLEENTPIYEDKFDELMSASLKLQKLEESSADKFEVKKQKQIVKNIKKDIDKLVKKENKIFNKSLTRLQRSKYAMIKKLEQKDSKSLLKGEKDYHKSNPQMSEFGRPTRSLCPIGREED